MPRRNHRMRTRAARRKWAITRDINKARFQTLKMTRKQARIEAQKLAWAKLPDWTNRRHT